ncbi:unnamed protein product [Urochloa decumbens]|uniref:GRF-type domain-containing protein n=1 Tax=Urochloa decumbens TaxID=240449 RepID=A0ABC9F041_9POAL
MVGGSVASASNPRSVDGLPLIMCTDCGRRRVMRCTSQQPWSLGQIFYCCPLHKRDGTGCPFWYWKDEYINVLATVGVLPASAGAYNAGGSMQVAESRMQGAASKMKGDVDFNGSVSNKKVQELIDIGKELVRLVKVVVLVCICMGVMMLVNVLVHLLK